MRDAHGHVGVCGRVDDYIDQPDNLMWAAVRQQGLVAKIRSIPCKLTHPWRYTARRKLFPFPPSWTITPRKILCLADIF